MTAHRRDFKVAAVGLAFAAAAVLTLTASRQAYQQNDPRVLALLDRTTSDAQQFDRAVDAALGRRSANAGTALDDDVDQLVMQLTETTAHLRDHYTRRQVVNADVEDVLARGARIDAYMRRETRAASAAQSWLVVRRDLDELARTFNVSWDWSAPRLEPSPGPQFYSRLSGTYQLDRTRGDSSQRVAEQATRGLDPMARQRVQQSLLRRLDPPEFIAIDRNGRSVSIASSKAPEGTFDIDGRPHSETGPNGNPITVRASFYGDELTVSTSGNRGTDFTVTFEPLEAGRSLRVTRRLDAAELSQPVQSEAFYRRTAEQPQWTVYQPPSTREDYPVPDRTILVGQLNTALGNRTSHQGDRFSLTVDDPVEYRGAVIDGVVSRINASGRPGRFDLIFDFDRIRLRDGRTAEFDGVLSEVRAPDGQTIAIDTSGIARAGDDRSDQALQRGALGATFGAIIGAIAGGGKGAAIGAAVGATAGAGSVYAEGHDVYLPPGTKVTVIARTRR